MKRLGMDMTALIGGSGFLASIVVSQWSAWAAGATAVATAVYMTIRAVREWIKLRQELHQNELTSQLDRLQCGRLDCRLRIKKKDQK